MSKDSQYFQLQPYKKNVSFKYEKLELQNETEDKDKDKDTYSEFNSIKFDLNDEEDRYILYNAFVAWVTKGSSIIPEADYLHNKTKQELPNRNKYFTDSDEKSLYRHKTK